MPSKSAKQAKLMQAVAHGWKPDQFKGPTRAVAKEFVKADERRGKVTGYQGGGGVMGRTPYRGVPPQRGMMSRGAGGDPRAMAGRMRGMAGRQRGMMQPGGGGMPQAGALRQMMQRMQSGAGSGPGGPGGLPPGIDPRAVAADPQGWARHQADPRFAAARGMPGGGGGMMDRLTQGRGGYNWQRPSPGGVGGSGFNPGEGELMRRGSGNILDRMNQQLPPGTGGDDFVPAGAFRNQEGLIEFGGYQGGGGGGSPTGMLGRIQQRAGGYPPGGGGSFGKPMPRPGTFPRGGGYPGGGNPYLGGRNPMMRGRGRYGGGGGGYGGGRRGPTSYLR